VAKASYPAEIISCYCKSLGTTDETPNKWHPITPYFASVGTSVVAAALHFGGGEDSDNGFIIAGPMRDRVVNGGEGFNPDGSGTFAAFYSGPEATELPVVVAQPQQRLEPSGWQSVWREAERSSGGGQHSSSQAAAAASSCSGMAHYTSTTWPITHT